MAGDASRENGRKGGRPKGSKSPETLEREATLKAYRERVCANAQRLLDAELTTALGTSYLYCRSGKGKDRKVERVEDEETIRAFLNDELSQGDDEYYFITAVPPDTQTIRGMLDRTFDRPAQRTELTGSEGQPLIPQSIAFTVTKIPGADTRN